MMMMMMNGDCGCGLAHIERERTTSVETILPIAADVDSSDSVLHTRACIPRSEGVY
jgi:hypothetical protein